MKMRLYGGLHMKIRTRLSWSQDGLWTITRDRVVGHSLVSLKLVVQTNDNGYAKYLSFIIYKLRFEIGYITNG
jgi:hypothetical protein